MAHYYGVETEYQRWLGIVQRMLSYGLKLHLDTEQYGYMYLKPMPPYRAFFDKGIQPVQAYRRIMMGLY